MTTTEARPTTENAHLPLLIGGRPTAVARARSAAVYVLVLVIGVAAFLYPFWLPASALPDQAHAGDAPLVAALVGALAVGAVALEIRRGTMTGTTVAVLGMLSALASWWVNLVIGRIMSTTSRIWKRPCLDVLMGFWPVIIRIGIPPSWA